MNDSHVHLPRAYATWLGHLVSASEFSRLKCRVLYIIAEAEDLVTQIAGVQ